RRAAPRPVRRCRGPPPSGGRSRRGPCPGGRWSPSALTVLEGGKACLDRLLALQAPELLHLRVALHGRLGRDAGDAFDGFERVGKAPVVALGGGGGGRGRALGAPRVLQPLRRVGAGRGDAAQRR